MSLDLLEPWGERILAAILVGGLFALLVGLFVRALPALSPATRSWLWWLVAARTLAELAGAPALELAWLPAQAPTVLHQSQTGAESGAPAAPALGLPSTHGFTVVAESGASPAGAAGTTSSARPKSIPLRLLSLLWTSLAALATLRLVREAHRLRSRLRRARRLHDGQEVEQLERLRHELAVRMPVRLAVSAEATTPYVAGLFRPTIVLPQSPRLTAEELEMALAHELAHVRRRDALRALVPLAAERLFCCHPLVRWAAREYALATEAACDAVVLARVARRPESYGRLLLRLATAPSSDLPAPAWPLARRPLERRLDMLSRLDSPRRLALAGLLGAGALTLLLALPVRLVAAAAPDVGAAPLAFSELDETTPAPPAGERWSRPATRPERSGWDHWVPFAPMVPITPLAPATPLAPMAPLTPMPRAAPRALAAPVAPVAPVPPTEPMTTPAPLAPEAPAVLATPATPATLATPVAPSAPFAPIAPRAPLAGGFALLADHSRLISDLTEREVARLERLRRAGEEIAAFRRDGRLWLVRAPETVAAFRALAEVGVADADRHSAHAAELAEAAAERAIAASELARGQAARRIEAEMEQLGERMAELAATLERARAEVSAADEERIGRAARERERHIGRREGRDVERHRLEVERRLRRAIEDSLERELAEPVQ